MTPPQAPIIAVSGNIGAGKTTLVMRLAQHYGFRAELEAVQDNPYLNDFYQNMARWAFPLQVYFLNQRFRQGLTVAQRQQGTILDRTLYEDAHIFAENLYQLGHLSERDYRNYRGLYETMATLLPPPHLIIYLQGSVAQLQSRIQNRYQTDATRQSEDRIPEDYLSQLNNRYDHWIKSISYPIITVNIDEIDLSDPAAFNQLVSDIDRHLSQSSDD